MTAPIVFIAGFGRCGTTAVSLMLWQGGAQMVDAPPAFESKALIQRSPEWFDQQAGKVTKWIDPMMNPVPRDVPARTIWLRRNSIEQARSSLKFIGARINRRNVRKMAQQLRRDEPQAMAAARSLGPLMLLDFETIISDPALAAWRLKDFVAPIATIDARAAARVIAPRPSACMPDLRIEANLTRIFAGA